MTLDVSVAVGPTSWLESEARWRVPIEVTFANNGSKVFELDKATACDGGRIRNNVFHVSVDGVEVGYQGIMAKRAHPGKDGFHRIQPGETHRQSVDIGDVYALPEDGGEMTVRFDHFNHFSDDSVQLRSADVAGTLAR